MTINGTLFVQMINFLIAYLLIDRFLLRTAVKVIQHEHTEYNQLISDVKQEQENVSKQAAKKINEWHQHQEQFMQYIPQKVVVLMPKIPELKTVSVSSEAIQKMVPALTEIIEEKVLHG